LVGFEDGGCCPGWHGFSVDFVGIVIVENKYVVVAKAGWADEPASLVSVDLARVGFDVGNETIVCPVVGSITGRECEGSIWVV
jgi:hypothetical protein